MKAFSTKLTCLLVLMGMANTASIQAEITNSTSSLIQGNNSFAFDLYGKLKSRKGNLFFSPLSISTSFGMVHAGARGRTEQQMAQVLHFGTNQNQLHAQFSQFLTNFNQKQIQEEIFQLLSNLNEKNSGKSQSPPTSAKAQLVNAIYVQKEQHLVKGFQDIVTGLYHASLKQVDFRNEKASVCKEINNWVAEKTSGKVQEILQPSALNDSTRLVLVNSIYFKAAWLFPFHTNPTTKQAFTNAEGQSKEVSMMNIAEGFRYYQDEELQALELLYVDSHFSMLVLLPRKKDGLEAMEKRLSAEMLADITSNMQGRRVETYIPKFKMSVGTELSECLKAMGMSDAFGPQADFSGIDSAKDLHISAVFHKAYVDVNEEGTEAAGSSRIVVSNGIDLNPPTFRADHPFMFFIRDMNSNSILFMGRVVDPAE